ncbi:uncharacterized protein F4812DRAFT_110601 [Daldinia caldariorum]|uniref:uncharacterized protein n=1 Tax=Daldinia caldariorum TaxID=326644 RepID=UPI0020087656|nr:uncharacterized protein F4812DRAFT_110601 [Daldinia caldariorum]KAI1465755.1 hypothetical protein F4812DRAFT_110601 [Daldinia caldariorum]
MLGRLYCSVVENSAILPPQLGNACKCSRAKIPRVRSNGHSNLRCWNSKRNKVRLSTASIHGPLLYRKVTRELYGHSSALLRKSEIISQRHSAGFQYVILVIILGINTVWRLFCTRTICRCIPRRRNAWVFSQRASQAPRLQIRGLGYSAVTFTYTQPGL